MPGVRNPRSEAKCPALTLYKVWNPKEVQSWWKGQSRSGMLLFSFPIGMHLSECFPCIWSSLCNCTQWDSNINCHNTKMIPATVVLNCYTIYFVYHTNTPEICSCPKKPHLTKSLTAVFPDLCAFSISRQMYVLHHGSATSHFFSQGS
jgi:hypothetical protein